MEREWPRDGLLAGALAFAVCYGTLVGLRATNATPPTAVQSMLVHGTAAAVVLVAAAFVYAGRPGSNAWAFAFGPSLAFTLNLFRPLSAAGPASAFTYAVVSAAFLAAMLGVAGYLLGHAARTVFSAGASSV
ncbi:hypothetical protein [Halarchaeum sp. P4]|uniref:hypothetical protein n=1 Tax=Halarchaeum sp. P4 TaxID=3421639 RepID=UPI003EC0344E